MQTRSPSNCPATLQAKVKEYPANGVLPGFRLDAEAERARVDRAGQPAPDAVRGYDRELSGELVLPGFQLNLRPLRRA